MHEAPAIAGAVAEKALPPTPETAVWNKTLNSVISSAQRLRDVPRLRLKAQFTLYMTLTKNNNKQTDFLSCCRRFLELVLLKMVYSVFCGLMFPVFLERNVVIEMPCCERRKKSPYSFVVLGKRQKS